MTEVRLQKSQLGFYSLKYYIGWFYVLCFIFIIKGLENSSSTLFVFDV